MRIEVIEKHEEGTPRLATRGEPVEKVAIDPFRTLALRGEEPITHDGSQPMEPTVVKREGQVAERLHGDIDQTRGPEGTESLEDVIFKVSKPTAQAGFIGTIAGIGDETGGRIAVSPQVFGQAS